MKKEEVSAILESLKETLEGEIFTDTAQRILYATDASAYREIPFGVARPKNPEDIRHLIRSEVHRLHPVLSGAHQRLLLLHDAE